MANRQYIPDALWIARRKRRLRQEDVAEALHLSRLTVVRAERGSPLVTPETLRQIADYLDVPFSELQYQEKILTQMSQTS